MAISRQRYFLVAILAFGAACTDATDPTVGTGRLRIVNSVFQGADLASSVPVAVDVLVDSSMTGAGLSGLAALALSPGSASGQGAGTHTGAGAIFTAADYRDVSSGIHSFVARVSGTSATFFRTGDGEYLPKQYMLPFPYTFVLAGVDTTSPPDPSAVPWAMIADDPFTPPADSARVQVINAAPMADLTGAGRGAVITATFDGGAAGVYTLTASYRGSSGYTNPAPGSYVVMFTTPIDTVRVDTLHTDTLTLAKGEVRTLIVQSTSYAAVPGPGNTRVTNLLDNQW